MPESTIRRDHWQGAYIAKNPDEVSWFQPRPDISLDLISRTGAGLEECILDVGGGASTLVDHLLDAGHSCVAVLDIAETALDHAKARLGEQTALADWIVADITQWKPTKSYGIWHDRAVLHFLTNPADQQAYVRALRAAAPGGGWAIIGGFARGGPTRCSGLEIVQHDADSLQRLLGDDFVLREFRSETHRTPWNAEQLFNYHLFQRKDPVHRTS